VHLYHVVKGGRDRFAGWNGKVASGVWHELAYTDDRQPHRGVLRRQTGESTKTTTPSRTRGSSGSGRRRTRSFQFDDLTATPE